MVSSLRSVLDCRLSTTETLTFPLCLPRNRDLCQQHCTEQIVRRTTHADHIGESAAVRHAFGPSRGGRSPRRLPLFPRQGFLSSRNADLANRQVRTRDAQIKQEISQKSQNLAMQHQSGVQKIQTCQLGRVCARESCAEFSRTTQEGTWSKTLMYRISGHIPLQCYLTLLFLLRCVR